MAKLPRSPIAQNVQNNYRPVQEARAGGSDHVGAALEGAGNAAFEIGERMADAKIAADAAEASIRLRSRLDEEYRAIENDMEGDPSGFETRFRERATAVANEEAGRMTSPAMRRAFGLKAQEQVETFSIGMRDVTRKRQVEGVKAQTLKIGSDYEQLAADPSKPRELLEAAREDYLALVRQQHKAGIYNPEQAEALTIGAEQVYRQGVSQRHLSTVDALLDAGRYGEATEYFKVNYGEVDPAQREKAEDVLEKKTLEGQAIKTADQFWADAGGDYGKAIAQAYEIENPDERLAVEGRLAQLKNQGDAGREAADKAHLEEGLRYIVDGKPIPSDLRRTASATVVDRLDTEVRTRKLWAQQLATLSAEEKRALKEASAVGKDYLKGFAALDSETYLAGPSAWPEPMRQQWDSMTNPDRAEVWADISQRTARGGTFDAADKVMKGLVAQVPMFGPDNRKGKDFDGTSKSSGAAKGEELAVRAALYRMAQEHARRTGDMPITPQDSKVMIARAFREANSKRYPFEEPGAFMRRVKAMPEYGDARDYLKEKLGREPSDEEVTALLRAEGGLE